MLTFLQFFELRDTVLAPREDDPGLQVYLVPLFVREVAQLCPGLVLSGEVYCTGGGAQHWRASRIDIQVRLAYCSHHAGERVNVVELRPHTHV